MEKYLRPQTFDTDTNSKEGLRKLLHWKTTFQSVIGRIDWETDGDKLKVLINFVDANVYSYTSDCATYPDPLNKLERTYAKAMRGIYARRCLITSRQNEGESFEDFLQRLKILSNNCNFVDVTAS